MWWATLADFGLAVLLVGLVAAAVWMITPERPGRWSRHGHANAVSDTPPELINDESAALMWMQTAERGVEVATELRSELAVQSREIERLNRELFYERQQHRADNEAAAELAADIEAMRVDARDWRNVAHQLVEQYVPDGAIDLPRGRPGICRACHLKGQS